MLDFVYSNFILFPTEANKQDGPASLTIKMMLFFGLARVDAGLSRTKIIDWTYSSSYDKREKK